VIGQFFTLTALFILLLLIVDHALQHHLLLLLLIVDHAYDWLSLLLQYK